MIDEFRSQITQLEEKVDGLEANLREKVSEIDELRAFNKDREDVCSLFPYIRNLI